MALPVSDVFRPAVICMSPVLLRSCEIGIGISWKCFCGSQHCNNTIPLRWRHFLSGEGASRLCHFASAVVADPCLELNVHITVPLSE